MKNDYEIVFAFKTVAYSDKGFKYYNYTKFYDENDFNSFVEKCRNYEFYNTNVKVNYGDKLITLSTCEYSQKEWKNGNYSKENIKVWRWYKCQI